MTPLTIATPAERRFVKALLFSPAGHGKTHFLGTAMDDERTSPMLLLDFEGGDETLSGLDIDVAPIRDWDDYNEAYEVMSDPDTKYRSMGIDSISETHIWGLLSRISEKGDTRKDPDLIEQGDYGVVSTQMRRLLREFRDLPLHVFYTASAKEIEERGVGKVKVPAMAGQMSDEVVHLMSVVGYLAKGEEDGETVRSLLFNEQGYRTKIRMPWGMEAPDYLDNPTITDLMDVLQIPMPTKSKSKSKSKSKQKEDE